MKYCIIIITHKRPHNQHTLSYLESCNVKVPVFLLVDDEDPSLNEYKTVYGSKVITFHKDKSKSDLMDNFDGTSSATFARNECFDVAKDLGFEHFIMFDDDVMTIRFRYLRNNKLLSMKCRSTLQSVFDQMIEFLAKTNVSIVSMVTQGMLLGGASSAVALCGFTRKAVTCFACSTNKRVEFKGRLFEDMINFVCNQNTGSIMISPSMLMFNTKPIETTQGGVEYSSDGYKNRFYVTIAAPQQSEMNERDGKFITKTFSNNYLPCILSSAFKKENN